MDLNLTNYDRVKEFHEVFEVLIESKPTIPDKKICDMRERLIVEEFEELQFGINNKNIILIADALADLLYVIYGTALSFGVPINEIFEEVHKSNMTKLWEDGKPRKREDGKILKPDSYVPPNIIKIFERFLKNA